MMIELRFERRVNGGVDRRWRSRDGRTRALAWACGKRLLDQLPRIQGQS